MESEMEHGFEERIAQPRPSDSNMSTSTTHEASLEPLEDEVLVVDVDDDVDDQGADTSEDEVDSMANVLGVGYSGRVFMVSTIQRASGGHRPNLLLDGRLMEIVAHGTAHRLQQVASSKELQLSLRYEPPSPKFARSCPDMISYRLKLLQGTQFLYLLRGLPNVLVLDQAARAVGWGVLQLVFSTTQQLECFLAVLRHVSVVSDQLWPRHIACLWRPNLSEIGTAPSTTQTASHPNGTDSQASSAGNHSMEAFTTAAGSAVQGFSKGFTGQPLDALEHHFSPPRHESPSGGPGSSQHPLGWPLLVAEQPQEGMVGGDRSGRGALVAGAGSSWGGWWRSGESSSFFWRRMQACVASVQEHPQLVGGVVVVAVASVAVVAMRLQLARAAAQ